MTALARGHGGCEIHCHVKHTTTASNKTREVDVMRAYLLPDHPVIRRAQRHGMDEPEVIGWCERCDEPIYAGYEHGKYEDMLFCDAECFHSWIGFEVVD